MRAFGYQLGSAAAQPAGPTHRHLLPQCMPDHNCMPSYAAAQFNYPPPPDEFHSSTNALSCISIRTLVDSCAGRHIHAAWSRQAVQVPLDAHLRQAGAAVATWALHAGQLPQRARGRPTVASRASTVPHRPTHHIHTHTGRLHTAPLSYAATGWGVAHTDWLCNDCVTEHVCGATTGGCQGWVVHDTTFKACRAAGAVGARATAPVDGSAPAELAVVCTVTR